MQNGILRPQYKNIDVCIKPDLQYGHEFVASIRALKQDSTPYCDTYRPSSPDRDMLRSRVRSDWRLAERIIAKRKQLIGTTLAVEMPSNVELQKAHEDIALLEAYSAQLHFDFSLVDQRIKKEEEGH